MNTYKTEQLAQDEKFDEIFSSEWWNGFGTSEDINKQGIDRIKSYLLSRDTALLEAFKKDVGEMVKEKIIPCMGNPEMMQSLEDRYYNQALYDLLSALN